MSPLPASPASKLFPENSVNRLLSPSPAKVHPLAGSLERILSGPANYPAFTRVLPTP